MPKLAHVLHSTAVTFNEIIDLSDEAVEIRHQRPVSHPFRRLPAPIIGTSTPSIPITPTIGRPRKIVGDVAAAVARIVTSVKTRPFNTAPPTFTALSDNALSEEDNAIRVAFHKALAVDVRERCERCQEYWWDKAVDRHGICKHCRAKDGGKSAGEVFFYSAANLLDFGAVPDLPDLTLIEQLLISRIHVAINVFKVRGQQYKYRGHIVHFFKNVAKVYSELPSFQNISI